MPSESVLLGLLALTLLVALGAFAKMRSFERAKRYHQKTAEALGLSVATPPRWYWITGKVLVAEGKSQSRSIQLRCIAASQSSGSRTILDVEADFGTYGPVGQRWFLGNERRLPDFFLAEISQNLRSRISSFGQSKTYRSRLLSVAVEGNFVEFSMSGLLNNELVAQGIVDVMPILIELAKESESYSRRHRRHALDRELTDESCSEE